jgi:predicted extracellular nuclease
MKKHYLLAILLVTFTLSACQEATPTEIPIEIVPKPSLPPTALISEVMAGAEGNNNYEFIEFYNPGDIPFSLHDFTLWYRLPTSEEEVLIYQWPELVGIPAHGYFLLVREGQDVGIMPNDTFAQSLNKNAGSLLVRNSMGETIDSLGWGNAPGVFTEGDPAQKLENDRSLVRKPGAAEGNHQDTNNNASDFQLTDTPNPQNTGSEPVPYLEQLLALHLDAPEEIEPGSEFEYILTVTNISDQVLDGIQVILVRHPDLKIRSLPESMDTLDEAVLWTVGQLTPGEKRSEKILLSTPWAYLDYRVNTFFATVGESDVSYFAPPVLTRSAGGTIPIGIARGLIDSEITVEGIATMYTGGYYAGSGNTKFYLEDETGGIQVQVFNGEGDVVVPIGAQVRVTGTVGVYRDSIQIVPSAVPEDVEILSTSPDVDTPMTTTNINQTTSDLETLPGRLIQVEGSVTRVEEFTYSYEIDLTDDEGHFLRLYVDKLTEMSVEKIELGKRYFASGILDLRDGSVLLYPRIQSDLQEIIPPALILTLEAPNTTLPGETFPVTLKATNYNSSTIQDLTITTDLPSSGISLGDISEGGTRSADKLTWEIPELEGNRETINVSFDLSATGEMDQFSLSCYAESGTDAVEILTPEPWTVFLGTTLPIWAIQGTGDNSPYVLDEARTAGVVTGVFPSLEGFFIQSTESDENPSTSDGLFVFTGDQLPPVSQGDLVEVSGLIREMGQQTQIEIFSLEDILVVGQGFLLPVPVELDPPQDDLESQAYFESLEGMLVEVEENAIAISPTSRYGEYVVVLEKHGVDRIWQGESAGYMIMVDDGTFDVHLDNSTLDYTVASGDQVSGLLGPLAYTYGRYKIEPLITPEITAFGEIPQELRSLEEDEFSIMTWNVQDLFDILYPHPSDPPRPRKAKYENDLTKIANTILYSGTPTIVAFQEVEHIGILRDLASHELIAEYGYQPVLIDGTDSRGIDVGYLVRGNQARILDVQQFEDLSGITSRPPLLIKVELETSSGATVLYVINNHFSSMSGGELATEPRRSAQAEQNASILMQLRSENPDANVIILGDLNSYYDAKPIDILRDAGLVHVFEVLDPEERYTYIYQGATQVLDHILVTPGLMDLLLEVHIFHANADFPPADPTDDSPNHKSDHDPVIAIFSLNP